MTEQHKRRLPTPRKATVVRQPLDSIGGIIAEAAKVYRMARSGKMEHDKARSLVWMLGQLRTMVETTALAEVEARLDAIMEGRTNGHESTNRATARPH